MAASTTNTSRELGAVAGVAILGSIVNGQLTVNLLTRLTAIGIPASYRSEVITASPPARSAPRHRLTARATRRSNRSSTRW